MITYLLPMGETTAWPEVLPGDFPEPPEFMAWPKIGRLNRDTIITEKIDGTNAQVYVPEDPDEPLWAGSRKRWITPDDDNFGFAYWVEQHSEELRKLGPGRHFGEWYGRGIQRGYGLDERRFALFNVDRWEDPEVRPECCEIVPVLGRLSRLDTQAIDDVLHFLSVFGSYAVPGFMRPEGIVIYHPQSRQSFKVTLEGDDSGKDCEGV